MPTVPLPSGARQGPGSTPEFQAPGAPSTAADLATAGQTARTIGRGAQQAGQAVRQMAQTLQDESEALALKKAQARAADDRFEAIRQYQTLEGENALDGRADQTLDEIRKRYQEAGKALTGAAKDLHATDEERFMLQAKRAVYGHETQSRRFAHIGQTRALGAQRKRSAVAAFLQGDTPPEIAAASEIAARQSGDASSLPPTPDEAQRSGFIGPLPEQTRPQWEIELDAAIEQDHELADLTGLPGAATRALVEETKAEVHSGILRGLIAQGRTKEAQEFLTKRAGKHIDPIERAEIEGQLARQSERTSARVDALRMVAEDDNARTPARARETGKRAFREDNFGGEALESLLRDLDRQVAEGKLTDEQADMREAEIRRVHQRRKDLFDSNAKAALDAGEAFLTDNIDSHPDSEGFPEDLFSTLDRYNALDDMRRFANSGQRWSHQPQAYIDLLTLEGEGGLRGMPTLEFYRRFRPKLDNAHWREAQERYAIANEQPIPPGNEGFSVSDKNRILLTAARLDIDTSDPDAVRQFELEVSNLVQARFDARREGNQPVVPATGEELQRLLDEFYLENKLQVPGAFGSNETSVYRITQKQWEREAFIEVNGERVNWTQVPRIHQEYYAQQIWQAGGIPTYSKIIDLWNKDNRPLAGESPDETRDQQNRSIRSLIRALDSRNLPRQSGASQLFEDLPGQTRRQILNQSGR